MALSLAHLSLPAHPCPDLPPFSPRTALGRISGRPATPQLAPSDSHIPPQVSNATPVATPFASHTLLATRLPRPPRH